MPTLEAVLAQLHALGIVLPEGPKRLGVYGDSPELSRELIALITHGNKRATASLAWAHEAEGEPLPAPGELEIILDDRGRPVLVTRTTDVVVKPFERVDATFAAREAEGDGSLASWRENHWRFFTRECARIGREPVPTMPVVCAGFDVLHVIPAAP